MEINNGKMRIKIHLIDWFLGLVLFLQGLSCLLSVIEVVNNSKSQIVRVLLVLGNSISDNWIAWSVFLVFFVVIYYLYFFPENTYDEDVYSLTWVLLLLNLAFCLKVYSTDSISEKIVLLEKNISMSVVIVAVLLFVLVILLIIARKRKADREFKRLFLDKGTEEKLKSDTISGQGESSDGLLGCLNERGGEFRVKYPCTYAFKSFVLGRQELEKQKKNHKLEENKVKHEKEMEYLKNQNYTARDSYMPEIISKDKKYNITIVVISTFLSLTIMVLLIKALIAISKDELSEKVKSAISYISTATNLFGEAREQVTSFLLSVGVIFLLAILIITVFLLIHTTIRLLLNTVVLSTIEDTPRLMMLWRAIKIFMFGTLEGVLRPLLFLPEFLECVEEMLLDMNISDIVDEEYSEITSNTSDEKKLENNKQEIESGREKTNDKTYDEP